MALTDDQLDRYARHIILKEVGGAGQQALLNASVAIVGAGGIGSPVIQYLAAAGVGRLRLIDDDVVDLSNLQRQTIFTMADIGRPKVEAAADWIRAANSDVTVEPVRVRIGADNVRELLADTDAIIDGCDNFATRLTVSDASVALRIPLVSAAVGQFDGQLATWRGWEAGQPCYRCLVGSDPARDELSCADQGVLGAITGIMGSLGASEVLRVLTAFGDDVAGRLLLVDVLAFRFRTIKVSKDPACRCAA
ncbi:MAG: HesA/MoeB/ThiF family protein [Rhizorhabdus sp.]|jgi:molybdopterin/thiamine biosynthesis adenylyltransferase|uniref:HesA/MoeB/ThiF family protein n=1 Tax=Rhizorhabdus sp. TaxID=1968843 RepID=UPI001B631A44|nr:HesA/MoeB/ThiF family protein [Rhizorhabdus sp.]MBP8235913.1 HesA/MoeB/ThiF family protein [Rhizorhabdus sp.]